MGEQTCRDPKEWPSKRRQHEGRDTFALVALTALITFIAITAAADAQQAGASRFKAASRTGPLTGARQPLSLLDKEQVKVVVHDERRVGRRSARADSRTRDQSAGS